jgi:ATP-dependent RNA helicase DeaD
MTFIDLGLSASLVERLDKLGFNEPTPIQAQAIPQILQGRDVVGQSQTGTGKTAAFSLPILEQVDPDLKQPQALILTPTRELAQQVARAIQDFSGTRESSRDGNRIYTLTVYGGQSMERQINALERGVHLVVGTPGRVIDLMDRGVLRLDNIRWVVLDEADEMLSMGFIDDVRKVLGQVPPQRQIVCFSATMPRQIKDLVATFLHDPVTVTVAQPKAAPTKIEQRVYMVPRGWTKNRALQPILELEDPQAAIIFVRTRATAAELTNQLQSAGYSADEYHGDLSQSQRERLLYRFRQSQVRWIVATDIAARGLDVDHLTHVINYDLPTNVETYIHRIGRTGRAGKTGVAISLINPLDRRWLQLIERRVKQTLDISRIPSRSQIEAKRIEKLHGQVKNALAGDRMASFLQLVSQLEKDYEAHAIAAAALQLLYDQTQPNWLNLEEHPPEIDSKPIKRGDSKPRRGGYNARDGYFGDRQESSART